MPRYLDVSMQHISPDTSEFLEFISGTDAISATVAAYDYGFFLTVPPMGIHPDVPDDLRKVMEYAKLNQASLIQFDADGAFHPVLPTFED